MEKREKRREKGRGRKEKRGEERRETRDERRDMLILKLLSIDQSVAGAKIPAVLSLHKQVCPPVNLRICSTPWSVFQDGSNKTILSSASSLQVPSHTLRPVLGFPKQRCTRWKRALQPNLQGSVQTGVRPTASAQPPSSSQTERRGTRD